jgi:hypothetical protein
MKNLIIKWIASLIGMLFSMCCFSQTPSDAARQYLKDFQTDGVKSVAAHMHSADLIKLKAELLPFLDLKKTPVAAKLLQDLFGTGATFAAISAYKAPEFATKLFTNAVKSLEFEEPKLEKFDVLGEVKEGADVHVLIRSKLAHEILNISYVDVLTVRLDNGVWRLLPPKDLVLLKETVETLLKTYSK